MMHTIDFAEINRAAVRQLYSLLLRWLPDGKRQGNEFVALNPRRADNRFGSFSVNMKTGEWGDFAIDVKGGDPISLFAYLKGMKQGEAAKELAAQIGIQEYRNGKRSAKPMDMLRTTRSLRGRSPNAFMMAISSKGASGSSKNTTTPMTAR